MNWVSFTCYDLHGLILGVITAGVVESVKCERKQLETRTDTRGTCKFSEKTEHRCSRPPCCELTVRVWGFLAGHGDKRELACHLELQRRSNMSTNDANLSCPCAHLQMSSFVMLQSNDHLYRHWISPG